MHRSLLAALTLLILTVARATAQPAADRPFPLMVGDSAPTLELSRWIPLGPHNRIQEGKPYIVEFWATWCGPCVRNFPKLSDIQTKYADQLTVIGVSVWEPRWHEVEPFIEKQRQRIKYIIGLDSCPHAPADAGNPSDWAKNNGKCALTWLRASGWNWDGIPVAFIIDARGRIAWIGNPRDMDAPLAAVVDGTWNTEAFAPQYRKSREVSLKACEIHARRRAAQRAGDHDAFLKESEALLALGPKTASSAAGTFAYMLNEMNDPQRAYAFARAVLEGTGPGRLASNDADALNDIAYTIVHNEGQGPGRRDLDIALAASQRAAELAAGKDLFTLTTLAEVHAARTEWADAARVMRKAAALETVDEDRAELETRATEYEGRAPAR